MSKDLIHLMHALFLPAAEGSPYVPWRPAADVYRTRDGFTVKFELAGVRVEDIDLEVLGSRMTLRGSRRDTCEYHDGCRCYLLEIRYEQFERSLELPCNLERAAITSTYRDGMLLVYIQTEART
jgi:HSP20 family protein